MHEPKPGKLMWGEGHTAAFLPVSVNVLYRPTLATELGRSGNK